MVVFAFTNSSLRRKEPIFRYTFAYSFVCFFPFIPLSSYSSSSPCSFPQSSPFSPFPRSPCKNYSLIMHLGEADTMGFENNNTKEIWSRHQWLQNEPLLMWGWITSHAPPLWCWLEGRRNEDCARESTKRRLGGLEPKTLRFFPSLHKQSNKNIRIVRFCIRM